MLQKPEGDAGHRGELAAVLGLRDVVLFLVAAVFGVRMLPLAASAGPVVLLFWVAALVLFVLPLGFAVADLSTRFPDEGGIYVWVKQAFGDGHGYMVAWAYWTANLAFFPSLLLWTSAQLLAVLPGTSHLTDHRGVVTVLSLATVLAIYLVNLVGLRVATVLHNLSSLARFVPVALVTVLAAALWLTDGPATEFSTTAFRIDWGDLKNLVFLSTIAYMLAGFEGASMLGGEVRDAPRTVPRGIVLSGAIVTGMYVVSTLGLMVCVPASELGGLDGFTEAVARATARLGGETAVTVATSSMAACLWLIGIGGMSVWFAVSARLPFVIGLDRYLPPAFGAVHPRWNTPHVALGALAAATAVLVVMSNLGGALRQVYSILISLEIVIYFIPYLYLFAALIALRHVQAVRDAIRVPGGWFGAMVAGISGFAVTLASLLLALLPGEGVDDPRTFYLSVFGSLTANLLVGAALFYWGKRRLHDRAGSPDRESHDPPQPA
jgi:amino acid transporter